MKIKKYDKYRNSFPYYKVQYWDKRNLCWMDIQKSFSKPEEAILHGIKLEKYRIIEIKRNGRDIYNPD